MPIFQCMRMPSQLPRYHGRIGPCEQGFTLIELLVTVSVSAILLVMAVPSFNTIIKDSRLITQANDFVATLSLARSEAIKRAASITVCTSNDGASCATSGSWDQGWIVFVDVNSNGIVTSPTTNVVRIHAKLSSGVTFKGTAGLTSYISYAASGTTQVLGAANAPQSGVLVMCDDRGFVSNARGIQISTTGRVSVTNATSTAAGSCL